MSIMFYRCTYYMYPLFMVLTFSIATITSVKLEPLLYGAILTFSFQTLMLLAKFQCYTKF